MPLSITAHKDSLDAGSRRHGGPADRGSADRYYGLPCRPHYYLGAYLQSRRIEADEMSPEQIAEYTAAWHGETDRKDFGDGWDNSVIGRED